MLYLFAAAPIIVIIWLVVGIRKIGKVSHGPVIDDRPNSAVLLIDLQTVFWDSGPYGEASKSRVQDAVEAEVTRAKDAGIPVIAARHEWSIPSTKMVAKILMKGQALAGSKGTELARPFAGLPDHTLTKRVQDAFETGEMDALLERLDVGRLRILGLDGNYCVAQTAHAARQRGFNVEIVSAGVLVADPAKYKNALKALDRAGVAQV